MDPDRDELQAVPRAAEGQQMHLWHGVVAQIRGDHLSALLVSDRRNQAVSRG